MTREEAIKTLKENYCAMCAYGSQDMDSCDIRSCDNKDAIKALEQEPCEDCVSRKVAIFLADELKQDAPDDERLADMVMAYNEGILDYQTKLSLLPSVTPQQKTGKWIDDKCSVCGKGIENLIDSREWYRNEEPKFCPFCGIKMEVKA